MRRMFLLLLSMAGLLFVSGNLDRAEAQAPSIPVCTDGQVMVGNRTCVCRPPLKFLPGNICGSGRKVQKQNTDTTVGIRAICEIGMVPAASGCRCEAPLRVLPGGRCGIPTAKGANCREGDSQKATGCKCRAPLMLSATRHCIRCLPGDGDRVVGTRCIQNVSRKR